MAFLSVFCFSIEEIAVVDMDIIITRVKVKIINRFIEFPFLKSRDLFLLKIFPIDIGSKRENQPQNRNSLSVNIVFPETLISAILHMIRCMSRAISSTKRHGCQNVRCSGLLFQRYPPRPQSILEGWHHQ